MTDRQIQELLLTHYLFAIEMVKEGNKLSAIEILAVMKVHKGICTCSGYLLDTSWCITPPDWIKQKLRAGEDYLGPLPYRAKSKSEILSRLKLRVDILQKEIQLSKTF